MNDAPQTPAALPVHPALAALNLPPFPWVVCNAAATVASADHVEVAYVPMFPDADTDRLEAGSIERTDAQMVAIATVTAAAPDLVNVIAHFLGKWEDPAMYMHNGKPIDWADVVNEARAVLARATGQKGGADHA